MANFTLHIGQNSSARSLRQNVGEIEQQFFCKTVCAGKFLPRKQSLVKLVNHFNKILLLELNVTVIEILGYMYMLNNVLTKRVEKISNVIRIGGRVKVEYFKVDTSF